MCWFLSGWCGTVWVLLPFLVNLPAYAEQIWNPENADYLHLMPVKERREKERETETEAEEENDGEDDEYGTGDLTEESMLKIHGKM
jgi:hypothetical protein